MRRLWLVARREVVAGVTKKAFVVATAIMTVLIVIGAFALSFFGERAAADAEVRTLAVAQELADFAPAVLASAESLGVRLETTVFPDRVAAEEALADGTIDAWLTGSPGDLELLFETFPLGAITQPVTSAAQSAALARQVTALGGDSTSVADILRESAPAVTFLEDASVLTGPRYALAIASVTLLFFALVNSGSQIAIGVVEEKSSRVVEILLATLRPTELFAGKVLGNGLLGLGQVVLYGVAMLGSGVAFGLLDGVVAGIGGQVVWLLVWFLLGFTIYAVLWGSLASLVSRQEDIGSVTAPVTILMLIPFYTAVFLTPTSPDGDVTRLLSLIPVFSPFMMPMRTALTDVPAWETALAIGLCLAVIPLLVWLAATVYRRGVLHTSGRLRLVDALRRR